MKECKMKNILILLLVMIMVPVCLSGCTSDEGKDIVLSCDDFAQKPNATADISVSKGQTVTVTLCSNGTTGFIWNEEAQIDNTGILKQTNHEVIAPEKSMPGAAGQEKWTFEAVGTGATTAHMEYSRPWEGGEKGEWTFTLTVNVK
jgi:predicted secreted protein